jgi:TonB family protein
LRLPKSGNAQRLAALLVSIAAHVIALIWIAGRPHDFGHRHAQYGTTAALQVSLLAPENSESTPPPLPSQFDEAIGKQQIPLSLPAKHDSDSFALAPTWYPANALSHMPRPVTQFTPQAIPGDDGSGGKISLRLWIDETGNLDRISILGSELSEEFEKAALTAFRSMRFKPGEIDGVPVKSWVDIVIEYADLRRSLAGN